MTENEIHTEVPEGGWTEEHDGDLVKLTMPLGTVIEDQIISMPIEGGSMLYGPSQEIGMILARASYAMAAQQAAYEYQANLEKQAEDWE